MLILSILSFLRNIYRLVLSNGFDIREKLFKADLT